MRSGAGLDAWSMEGLGGVCFPTRGAATVETEFNAEGTPQQLVGRTSGFDFGQPHLRGRGIGLSLLAHIARIAVERDCGLMAML